MKVLVLYTLPPPRSGAGAVTGRVRPDTSGRGDRERARRRRARRGAGRGSRGTRRPARTAAGRGLQSLRGSPGQARPGASRGRTPRVVACSLHRFRQPDAGACRRKDLTKAVLAAAGVPVPRAGGYPCIVKPVDEDGSAGIDQDSVCADAAAVEKARARLAGPAVVEAFLPGTEYVVTLWGGSYPENVAIGEVFFDDGLRLFTYAAKWRFDSPDYDNSWIEYQTEIDPRLRESTEHAGTAGLARRGCAWLPPDRHAAGRRRHSARARRESQPGGHARKRGHVPAP